MRRRDFIGGLGGAAVAWPMGDARAQQPDRISRVGILTGTSDTDVQYRVKAFLEALAQLGWTEGRNLRIDYRSAGSNDPEAIRSHAEALVRAAPDVIFTSPATSVQVLQRLTRMIPIVFVQYGDRASRTRAATSRGLSLSSLRSTRNICSSSRTSRRR